VLTKQIFYLPVLRDDVWRIKQFNAGQVENLTKEQFENFVKN
jgi:hypothetical protein